MSSSRFSPRDVGRLIDEALAAYRANFIVLIKAVGATLFPVALLYGITQVFYVRGILDLVTATASPDTPEMSTTMMIAYALTGTASLAYYGGQMYFKGVVYASAGQLLVGPRPQLKEMLKGGLGLFFPLVAIYVIVGFAVGAAGLASLWLLGAGALIVSVFLTVAGPAYAFERGNVLRALSRSASLVRGNFWRVVLLTAALGIVMFELESALTSPIVIRDVVLTIQNPGAVFQQLPTYWKVLEGLIQALSITLVVPLAELTWVRCYLDLRARNEGLDLLMRANELAARAR